MRDLVSLLSDLFWYPVALPAGVVALLAAAALSWACLAASVALARARDPRG